MAVKPGTMHFEHLRASEAFVALVDGWTTNRWAEVQVTDSGGSYPTMRVRAAIAGTGEQARAVVTRIVLGDGMTAVSRAQVANVARAMPNIPAWVLAHYTFPTPGQDPTDQQPFVNAMTQALRRSGRSATEREDEALEMWESRRPGETQADLAAQMDPPVKTGTFTQYLSRARKRRGQ